jgi:hypothetical protein
LAVSVRVGLVEDLPAFGGAEGEGAATEVAHAAGRGPEEAAPRRGREPGWMGPGARMDGAGSQDGRGREPGWMEPGARMNRGTGGTRLRRAGSHGGLPLRRVRHRAGTHGGDEEDERCFAFCGEGWYTATAVEDLEGTWRRRSLHRCPPGCCCLAGFCYGGEGRSRWRGGAAAGQRGGGHDEKGNFDAGLRQIIPPPDRLLMKEIPDALTCGRGGV